MGGDFSWKFEDEGILFGIYGGSKIYTALLKVLSISSEFYAILALPPMLPVARLKCSNSALSAHNLSITELTMTHGLVEEFWDLQLRRRVLNFARKAFDSDHRDF